MQLSGERSPQRSLVALNVGDRSFVNAPIVRGPRGVELIVTGSEPGCRGFPVRLTPANPCPTIRRNNPLSPHRKAKLAILLLGPR
jgi:hypothetical protein